MFEAWSKRSGGKFRPHEEKIAPGDYSDDTQLILAVARARLCDGRWWENLAFSELPFWTSYERGGGGATRRAATTLLSGTAPWLSRKKEDVDRYFNAGGNGVAMRVLPHCLFHHTNESFDGLAVDILTDGVATHGNPRALVGALAYGYGLWTALKVRGTLGYGELLEKTRASKDIWSQLPDISDRWPHWRESANYFFGDLEAAWSTVADEMDELLSITLAAISDGALAIDDETLEAIGCFNSKVNGAGTVAAAASLFLASRHAASPLEGISLAAQAEGADTDTIASMTGALLGAVVGSDWLSPLHHTVQDANYLTRMAERLRIKAVDKECRVNPLGKTEMESFYAELRGSTSGQRIELPIGMDAVVSRHNGIVPKSAGLIADAWRLEAEGQTIFVKQLSQAKERKRSSEADKFSGHADAEVRVIRAGVALTVSNLTNSKKFYNQILGLPVTKESSRYINFAGALTVQTGEIASDSKAVTLFIEVSNVEICFERFRDYPELIIERPTVKGGRIVFVCKDPDGYIVDVFQDATSAKS
jgi:ADP-ribosylglycohydrolase/predicted enzyme related to lactoylglutathione lyase